MKIGYFISTIGISGGIKVVLQHVTILKKMGYDVVLITREIEEKLNVSDAPAALIVSKGDNDVPDCDLWIGTRTKDVGYLFKHMRGKVVHLCQGYEPMMYMARIKKEFMPEKYSKRGVLSLIRQYLDIMKSKRKIKRVESVYALPTIKAAVSKHLVALIEKKYNQRCFLLQNGIDTEIFYPSEKRGWRKDGNIRILSVGSMHVGFKGIQDALEAVKLLKNKGVNIEFIRVSLSPPSPKELDRKIVDKFYQGLNEKEMGDLYRNVDIFVSPSLEMEGFGLPAMEALASGVPSILTEISSYKSFDEKNDFAYFVPTHRPDKIVEGVLAFMEDQRFRENCIKRGLRVAKKYSLEITREHLVNFIKELG